MSKQEHSRSRLPHLHVAAVLGASFLIGCAFMLSPSQPVEANKITHNLDLASQEFDESANQNSLLKPSVALLDAKANSEQDSINIGDAQLVAAEVVESAPEPTIEWKSFKVKSGDSLYKIFRRAGLSPQQLASVTNDIKDKSWAQLYPGEHLEFGFQESDFTALKIHRSQLEKWHIQRTDGGNFAIEKELIAPEVLHAYAEGSIESSLFLDGKRAGMSDTMIMELANIFGWDIDFILDIRKGDSFRLVYEEKFLDGEKIGDGAILSAQFVNQGKTFTAVRYEDSTGRVNYYTPEGDSMKKAFRRSPLDFARISSHFNLKRKHPVLHKIRAHRGTDYAARTGTPIKATGDGKVIFAGRKGGYGKVVIIQHGQSISTLYAHMNSYRKGIRTGKRVSQGQVIGYVGSTGMATGPHLHYEFRVNGIHKNPVTVSLPKAQPVAKKELKRFKTHATLAVSQLETFASGIQVAQSESATSNRRM